MVVKAKATQNGSGGSESGGGTDEAAPLRPAAAADRPPLPVHRLPQQVSTAALTRPGTAKPSAASGYINRSMGSGAGAIRPQLPPPPGLLPVQPLTNSQLAVSKSQLKGGKDIKLDGGTPTPVQIFTSEVTRALKKKLPNLSNPQIQRIVADKWCKMSDTEKQVYRKKAKMVGNSMAASSSNLAAAPPPPPAPPLPKGWRRALVKSKTENGNTRLEMNIYTDTGAKLRSKEELLQYTRVHNIAGVNPEVFNITKHHIAAVNKASPKLSVVDKPKNAVNKSGLLSADDGSGGAPPPLAPEYINVGGVPRRIIVTDSGMKMVRLKVTTQNGDQKEALVPVVKAPDGTLKVAFPK